jgi:SAM-dependent methyltransferase
LRSLLGRDRFVSRDYWEQRYCSKGNSGAGSCGRLAAFKAEVLNDFVEVNAITRVAELGCGDGNQLALANYSSYVGFDVSPTALDLCRSRFRDGGKHFFPYARKRVLATYSAFRPQLVLSLDVIYHLVEDDVFNDYMRLLFASEADYVIIYSDDGEVQVDVPHIRNRSFTLWVAANAPNWRLVRTIPNMFPWDGKDESEETSISRFFIYQRRTQE